MNAGDSNPLHIVVVAASTDRRNAIAAIAARATQARTTIVAGISLERIFQRAPDLTVVDVDSHAVSTALLRAAEALPQGTGLIALVDGPDPKWVEAALRAGVNAILSREVTNEEMRLAVLAAETGLILLHPSSVQDLGSHSLALDRDSPGLVEALTAREQEVLRLASEGLGNKEIAARLSISDHTVKFHISSILGKLGVASRTEAVSQGIKRGLIVL
jgi:DNA-binding NarL/FixJ family response regulator